VSVQIATARPTQPVSTGQVELVEIEDAGQDITGIFGRITAHADHQFVFTPRQDRPVELSVDPHGMLALTAPGTPDQVIEISHRAKRVFVSGNRAYAVGTTAVSEVVFNELNGQIRATVRKVGSIADLPTTRTYPGCVVQNLLGHYLVSVFPDEGQCRQHQLPELAGWQILGAKYEQGVLVVSAEQHGDYRLWLYRLDGPNREAHEISRQLGDVNFAVTERGIAAIMEPGGTLRICSTRLGSTNVRRIPFPEPDAQLFARDHKIVCAIGAKLYDVVLK
jgi:hypothetical protein